MNINKITILPISTYGKAITINKPTIEEAKMLITDKFTHKNENIKIPKKLPKILKDFVNTDCWIGSSIKK
jgi:hypothetical protein